MKKKLIKNSKIFGLHKPGWKETKTVSCNWPSSNFFLLDLPTFFVIISHRLSSYCCLDIFLFVSSFGSLSSGNRKRENRKKKSFLLSSFRFHNISGIFSFQFEIELNNPFNSFWKLEKRQFGINRIKWIFLFVWWHMCGNL